MLHELPDLFCAEYDRMDVAQFREHAAEWGVDTTLENISEWIARKAVAGDLTPGGIQLRLNNAGTLSPEATRFAFLRGLDRAFLQVNPVTARPGPSALEELASYAAIGNRLDSGQHGGALLMRPRLGPAGHGPEHPRDAFRAVVRVPRAEWDQADFVILSEQALLHRHELRHGIRVGCVPLVADPDELCFERDTRHGASVYRIRPRDLRSTHDRVGDAVRALRKSGVRIGVVPELTLTPGLLDTWRRQLRDTAGGGDPLHWVLAGSGNIDTGPRPVNAAVLLDARTGETLVRQDKLFRFDFSPDELVRWNLTPLLGDAPLREDMRPGSRLKIVDGGGLRLAILLCEDASRVVDLGPVIRAFAVSHVLMPVFSRPLREHRWEHDAAKIHAVSAGAVTVVSNSQVVETLLGGKDPDRGCAMAVSANGVALANAAGAAEVVSFSLGDEGTVDLES